MTGGRHRRPCNFCKVHAAEIKDTETGLYWCLGCATDLIHAGDAITEYTEFDEGNRYKALLAKHGGGLFTRFRPRQRDEDDDRR